MRLWWIIALSMACGGKIDTGIDGGEPGGDASSNDAKPSPDVIALPDTSVTTCQLGMGEGSVASDGSCAASQTWTCGGTTYTVACNCPKSACYCTTGSSSATVLTTIMCPSCNVTTNIDKIAQLCGYPQP